jgi:hypothetical protein
MLCRIDTSDLDPVRPDQSMRDLAASRTPAGPAPPKGLAFEIADHVIVRNWAALSGVRILVRLDHGAEDEEYEEVIEIGAGVSLRSQWIMWRDAISVFIQPILGKSRTFSSVAEALDSFLLKQRIVSANTTMALSSVAKDCPKQTSAASDEHPLRVASDT